MPKRTKQETGISLDVELVKKLDERAKLLGLSRSAMINITLRQAFGLIPDGMLGKQ